MVRTMKRYLVSGSAILVLSIALSSPLSRGSSAQQEPTYIAYYEAEILIYTMPDAAEVRKRGGDVNWIRETGDSMNQEDYYHFLVLGTLETAASPLVGHYAVSKCTADVWKVVPEPELVTSQELKRIQEILREAHGIDEATIRKYRDKPVWAP